MWLSNYGTSDLGGYRITGKDGKPNLKRYKATFDYSLDLIKLRELYKKVYRNNRFSCMGGQINKKEYSSQIINVTFEYSVKEFNRTGKNIYLKMGLRLNEVHWDDCIGYFDEEIVAVKVNTKVTSHLISEGLPKCFYVKDGQYKVKSNIKQIRSVAEIRNKLYEDGFVCNGIKYVRWKRSSGSARVGKCLFINEKLYKRMHIWEMCGLNVADMDEVDLAALESYISLTSSSIIGLLHIEPKNILVVDDYDSVFADDVINVTEKDGMLHAKRETTQISNKIWDGETLIDKSLMGDYQSKGMVLLRNRMFKSCAFNSNIQKWFADNNITSVSQLNGYTLAKNISDVKFITTPSSIKYLKFSTLEKWFETLDPTFGVVKYEKPTHFMDGRLVQTHYQLINSIQLSKKEVYDLLLPTFDFMTLVKKEPAALHYWIKFRIEDELTITPEKSKSDIVYKLMSLNEDFYNTKLYYDFKSDFLKSFTKDLKCGHVLVNGNYSVLCGNPIELLMYSIGKFDGSSVIEKDCIYSTRFDWNKTILGSRSPHPTICNVLLAKNRDNNLIREYMNSTNEIVYVNSINNNILQKLSGADYYNGLPM